MLLDIHTHHINRTQAVINASVSDFNPTEGLYYSVGIHPWYIEKTNCEQALKSLSSLSALPNVLAIGECGLDSLISTPLSTQIAIFEKHIALSEEVKKPLIIHCVHRSNEILQLYRKHHPRQPWIMHGFRANANVLRPILEQQNIYISIGEKFNATAVTLIPQNRLLIETDESSLPIEAIAAQIGIAKTTSTTEVIDVASKNLLQIFGI